MLSVLLWRTWRGRMSEPRTRDEAVVKIACVQMEPVVGQKERNVRRTLEFIEQAAANGAHLVVLPELCNSGYVFESRQPFPSRRRSRTGRPVMPGRTSRASAACTS